MAARVHQKVSIGSEPRSSVRMALGGFLVGTLFAGAMAVQALPSPRPALASGLTQIEEIIASEPASREALHEAITPVIDQWTRQQVLGERLLGRYWRQASPEQQQAFTQAYEHALVNAYGGVLRKLDGFDYQILGFRRTGGNQARAGVKVQDQEIEFELRHDREGWHVTDAIVAGVSLVGLLREDLRARMEAVDRDLERLIQQLRQDPAPLASSEELPSISGEASQ